MLNLDSIIPGTLMHDFLKGKCAVSELEDPKLDEFLQFIEDIGITWGSHDKPTQYKFNRTASPYYMHICKNLGDYMYHDSRDYLAGTGHKIVTASEIMKEYSDKADFSDFDDVFGV